MGTPCILYITRFFLKLTPIDFPFCSESQRCWNRDSAKHINYYISFSCSTIWHRLKAKVLFFSLSQLNSISFRFDFFQLLHLVSVFLMILLFSAQFGYLCDCLQPYTTTIYYIPVFCAMECTKKSFTGFVFKWKKQRCNSIRLLYDYFCFLMLPTFFFFIHFNWPSSNCWTANSITTTIFRSRVFSKEKN